MIITFFQKGEKGRLVIDRGEVIESLVACEKTKSALSDLFLPAKNLNEDFLIAQLEKYGCTQIEFFKSDTFEQVDAFLETHHFYGSLLIKQHEKILFTRGYGFSDISHHQLNTSQTAHHLFELSELFAISCIYNYQNEGRLKLEDSLDLFFKAESLRWPYLSTITVRDLIDHTSGLSLPMTHSPPIEDSIPTIQILHHIFNHPPLFYPREFTFPSAANAFVLASIIEKIADEPYHKLLPQTLGAPLSQLYDEQGSVKLLDHISLRKGFNDLSLTTGEILDLVNSLTPYLTDRSTSKLFKRHEMISQAAGFTADFLFGHRLFMKTSSQGIVAYFPKQNLKVALLGNRSLPKDITLNKLLSMIASEQTKIS